MKPDRALAVLFVVLAQGRAFAAADASAPILADAELDRTLAPLDADAESERRAAADAAQKLGPDAVPAITKKLAELRKTPANAVGSAVKPIANGDLYEGLLATKGDAQGWHAAVTAVVLLRALGKIGTTPAATQLVKVAVDYGGALRPEVALDVKALGEKAIPALIETKKDASSDLRHWAYAQLEAMGKRVPGDAVQTKDNQVLADVLHAFAVVHDMDALPVLLSFVNADRVQIRTAARDAILQLGQDAIWKLREAYANVTGKPAVDGWPASAVAKELFAAFDRIRLQEVYGLLDEGLAKEKEGKHEEAVTAFDRVLARQPAIERKIEMVPAYVALAQSIEDSDPPRALALFRKAARIGPESARAKQIDAEIAYLEGKDLLAHGVVDPEPFKRALELDPGNDKARAELERLDAHVEERQSRIRIYVAIAVGIVVAILGLVLFGGRRTRRRAAT